MKRIFAILLFITATSYVLAADSYKYWVQFTDKDSSLYALDDPSVYLSTKAVARRIKQNIPIDSTDLPVNESYIDSVLLTGVSLHTKSKWLNGITISVTDTSLMQQIANLPFVQRIELTYIPNYLKKANTDAKNIPSKRVAQTNNGYGNAYAQINMHNGDWLHQAGFKGQGITIAVLDVGYLHVNALSAFSQAFTNGQILGTHDFVNPASDFYSTHEHGCQVLSVMAAYDYNNYIGTAPEASYWLFRSEDELSEFPVEIDNMVAAFEFADSVGVDIVTSSLGYSNFNNPIMSYTYAQMDGLTSRASIAQRIANRKGMIVLNSAGNEGAKPWHYITAPADADSIITVGAVTETLERSSFSGWGPTYDGRIKPTVCALGTNTAIITSDGNVSVNNGTSLACPIIAGLTACLWQALPDFTNAEIIDLIVKNGSQFETPDNEIGFGIPDFYAAYTEGAGITKNLVFAQKDVKIYPNPAKTGVRIELSTDIVDNYAKLSFVLINLSGRKVFTEKIKGSVTDIPLSRIRQGVYTILIQSGEQILYREKLIKK